MSAFAVVASLRGDATPGRSIDPLLDALEHRGRDGRATIVRSWAALGTQNLWITTDDREDTQPWCDDAHGIAVVFDGRLDNRSQLIDELRIPKSDDQEGISDARLTAAAYARWREECFERLLGPFSLVVVDLFKKRLVGARDPLGDRTLSYFAGIDELVIASEPAALLRHPSVSSRLDETTVARFFAVEAPRPGATFFEDIRELPPGHRLVSERNALRVERFWPPANLPQLRYRSDAEYVEHFRSLLVDAVRCRLRSPSPPAVLMSGGLDSTSVAAIAARELDVSDPDARLTAISWVFDELDAADERRFIDPMINRYGLAAHSIVGDGEWPLRDLASWPVDRNAPWQGLYSRLQNAAYAAVRRAGSSVLLTGEYGDHLYLDSGFWLRDLVAEGRWVDGWRGIRDELDGQPVWNVVRRGRARSAIARALGRHGTRKRIPGWLTPHARALLVNSGVVGLGTARGRERPRWTDAGVLDPIAAHAASLEVANASRAGVEVRRPFRDRRLVEFALSIPAHLLYRPGESKSILRRAMREILPEPVRLRRHISTLLPLAARGLVEREADTVRDLLERPDALWRRYVEPGWLAGVFPSRLRSRIDGVETVVPWQCICAELWRTRLDENDS